MIDTEIDIAAPPAAVRSVMLDFARYEWSHGSFRSIVVVDPPGKPPHDLAPGDRLDCDIISKFQAVITQNSEALLQWRGLVPLDLLSGLHSFHFDEHPTRPGTTRFRQTETQTGYLAWVFSPWLLGRIMITCFESFNRDLKQRVETSSKEGKL